MMLDHISDWLYAPTTESVQNLRKEHVRGEVLLTGNTVVDALEYAVEHNKLKKIDVLESGTEFCLCTAHRQENVDDPIRLKKILQSLGNIQERIRVVFPLQKKKKKMIERFSYQDLIDRPGLMVCDPFSYAEMLWALKNARFILTDSGGLQEESCILGVPCVTLRDNTERPETVALGSNVIAGVEPEAVINAVDGLLGRELECTWDNPFGDGYASKRIADSIAE